METITVYKRNQLEKAYRANPKNLSPLLKDFAQKCYSCGCKWVLNYSNYPDNPRIDYYVCRKKSCQTLALFRFLDYRLYWNEIV
jgi:hypothetical protein